MAVDAGRDLAEAKAGMWKSHDERSIEEFRECSKIFYEVMCSASEEKLNHAAEMFRRAFWLADEGEKYQEEDQELEDYFYNCAETCLEEGFETVGMKSDIASLRREWWQGYRHSDEIEDDLSRDLQVILGEKYEESDLENFMRAAAFHSEDQWEKCVEELAPIYTKVVEDQS